MTFPTQIRILALTAASALVVSACTSGGEGPSAQDGAEGEESPDQATWADSPGLVVHTADRETLVIIDPESGEELDRTHLGMEEPFLGFHATGLSALSFSPDFTHMARVDDDRPTVLRLPDMEVVAEYEAAGDGLSTDARVRWTGFSEDGERLRYLGTVGGEQTLHEVEFAAEGAEPEELDTAPEGSPFVPLTGADPLLGGSAYEEFDEKNDGYVEIRGTRVGATSLPEYLRIKVDQEGQGPRSTAIFEDFVLLDDGGYLGFTVKRTGGGGGGKPDIGHAIGFELDENGRVADWWELTEEGDIDAFALSPDEERIALSKDGEVFVIDTDGSGTETVVPTGDEEFRVLGWF
ncbi:hypothetical protein [Nocardiopsis sp. MG754419]|uniref:hypothetical protein n=1 Tax=Nocardiopsis sp. MG754419 TaxID=2259865 RepID=UPI001BAE1963|nr:hypothetical protein [Nocardiopsis sp. MG754419]MBR8741031.1 hypothetical protein [Nocardiopsis sp. MG754419]